jgi:hypothetical protein
VHADAHMIHSTTLALKDNAEQHAQLMLIVMMAMFTQLILA